MKKKFILFHTLVPWSFPLDYISEMAHEMSKYANVIYFNPSQNMFNPFRDLSSQDLRREFIFSITSYFKKLTVFIPLQILPFNRLSFIKKINERFNGLLLYLLVSIKGFERVSIEYLFFPMDTGRFKLDFLVYDCMDLPFNANDKRESLKWGEKHKKLVKEADAVFVNSNFIKRFCSTDKLYYVPSGFVLRKYFYQKKSKKVLSKIPKPIIGFIGYALVRLDIDLIIFLAKKNKNMSFVFVGPIRTNVLGWSQTENEIVDSFYRKLPKLKKLKNVYFIGEVNKKERHNYIHQFDVGIIPYNTKIAYVPYGNAIKAYEYLCMGKPVVSTKLKPLLDRKPYVQIANNKYEFLSLVKKAVNERPNIKKIKERQSIGFLHDVSQKARKVDRILTNITR